MWCVLLLGLATVAFGEEAPLVPIGSAISETGKRDADRGNVVVYGSSPGNYLIQNPEVSAPAHYHSQLRLQLQPQNAAGYQAESALRSQTQPQSQPQLQLLPQLQPQPHLQPQPQPQSEIYINNYRKPQASTLSYSHQPSRRPQYVTVQQLAALQQAALQQDSRHTQDQGRGQSQGQGQGQVQGQGQAQLQAQDPAYEGLLAGRQAGHGSFYRPTVNQRIPQQSPPQPQHDAQQVQFASSAIVDSTAGSFEEELAQLVAANRAQEQKYNAAQNVPVARKLAPLQYLKEVTRPAPRPATRPAPRPVHIQPQPQPQTQYEPTHVVPQPGRQAPALYRYVYQHEPQLQQAKQEEHQYARQQQQQQHRAQHQPDNSLIRQLLADSPKSIVPILSQPEAPSRSQIYVSQQTQYKKPHQHAHAHPHANTQQSQQQRPLTPIVRIPSQRDKPLTQEEFQSLLQLGGYTATLLPSSQSLPHQEYLLQPRYLQPGAGAQAGDYLAEGADSDTGSDADADADAQNAPAYQTPAKRRTQTHYSPTAA